MRLRVRSLATLSGLRIRRGREPWCRLQTRLGSPTAVALAQAGGYGSNSTPSLGISTCRGSGPKNGFKKGGESWAPTSLQPRVPGAEPGRGTHRRTWRVPCERRRRRWARSSTTSPFSRLEVQTRPYSGSDCCTGGAGTARTRPEEPTAAVRAGLYPDPP